MKLLFNEQYGTCTYFWYQLEVTSVEQLLPKLDEIFDTVNAKVSNECQLYFYTKEIHQDAIGDQVRTTLMITKTGTSYDYNLNFADSVMATKAAKIKEIKAKLSNVLNQ